MRLTLQKLCVSGTSISRNCVVNTSRSPRLKRLSRSCNTSGNRATTTHVGAGELWQYAITAAARYPPNNPASTTRITRVVLSSRNTGHLFSSAGANTHRPAFEDRPGHGSNPYPQHPCSFSFWFFKGSANGYVVRGVATHSHLAPAATVLHTHFPVSSEQYPRPPHVPTGSQLNLHLLSPTPTQPASHTQSSSSKSQSPWP
mmetsp:Transcript_2785/g.10676  ORF Transcript_2785/g.10676 Transcript_2785/m.10676 type:complete len:201 (-) Transcript_2785:713-1315(-)